MQQDPAPQMKRLPRGIHGLSREAVAASQRGRILQAMTQLVSERGYPDTTVVDVVETALVSRRTFYVHFADKTDAFLAIVDVALEEMRGHVLQQCGGGGDWATRVMDALAALLDYLESKPAQARLLLIEGVRAGSDVYARYQEAIESFAVRLRDGAPRIAADGVLPDAIDEAVVSGMVSLLSERMEAGEAENLDVLLPVLTEFALRPYLGGAEARRIAARRYASR